MDEKRTPSQEGRSLQPADYRLDPRSLDCYGGGSYAVAQHISETMGGYRGFNRDKPRGRLASRA